MLTTAFALLLGAAARQFGADARPLPQATIVPLGAAVLSTAAAGEAPLAPAAPLSSSGRALLSCRDAPKDVWDYLKDKWYCGETLTVEGKVEDGNAAVTFTMEKQDSPSVPEFLDDVKEQLIEEVSNPGKILEGFKTPVESVVEHGPGVVADTITGQNEVGIVNEPAGDSKHRYGVEIKRKEP